MLAPITSKFPRGCVRVEGPGWQKSASYLRALGLELSGRVLVGLGHVLAVTTPAQFGRAREFAPQPHGARSGKISENQRRISTIHRFLANVAKLNWHIRECTHTHRNTQVRTYQGA